MMTPAQLMMQQMIMQQQQQLQGNPISQGTLEGMRAAEKSIQMHEGQRRKAFSAGISNFAAHRRNDNVQQGQLARTAPQLFADALGSAGDTYLAEEAKAKELNARLLARQMEQEAKRREEQMYLAKMQYEMEKGESKAAEDRAYNKRYLDIMENKVHKDNVTPEQEMNLFKNVPEGDVPLKLMGKTERASAVKDMVEMTKAGKPAMHIVKEAKVLNEILGKYPDLSTDLARAWKPGSSKEPTSVDLIRLSSMDQKKRTALEKGEKIIQDLLVSQVKSMKGTSTTDIIKQAIASALPHMSNSSEANQYILRNVIEEFSETADQARRAQKGLVGQYYTPRRTPEVEEEHSSPNSPELASDIQSLANQVRQEYPELSNATDEEIKGWVDAGYYEKARAGK